MAKMYEVIQDGDCWDEPMTLEDTTNHLRSIAEAMRFDASRIDRMANELESTGEPVSMELAGSYLDLEVEVAE